MKTTKVVVNVLDVDDHPPYFLNPSFDVEVFESTPVGSTVFTVSAIDSDVELRDVKEECHSNKSTIDKEEVAHFRRIFDDIARFIMYLPNPEPFNFVFDPNALGAREAESERANELLRPFVVQGYPEVDDYQGEHVNAKRSARQVPVAFWKDWT